MKWMAVIVFSVGSWAWAGKNSEAQVIFAKMPNLKESEYAVFVEDKYEIFTTEKVEELELDSNCAKKKPPTCLAFLARERGGKGPVAPKHPGLNNPAALFCEAQEGRNLIAMNFKKQEFNFCRFKDGSMVNSWSLYLKKNPIPVAR